MTLEKKASMMSMVVDSKCNQEIMKISLLEDNSLCADCNSSDVKWASTNLGVFICLDCCGIHRNLGTHISKVKSINLDVWDDNAVENMKEGNLRKNQIYEPFLFSFEKPLNSSEHVLWRKRYIVEKYVNKTYQKERKFSESLCQKTGWLKKEGSSFKSWKRRYFVLKEGLLIYFSKDSDKKEKGRLTLSDQSKVTFDDNNKNTIQVIGLERVLPLQAASEDEMMEWYYSFKANIYLLNSNI